MLKSSPTSCYHLIGSAINIPKNTSLLYLKQTFFLTLQGMAKGQ